MSNSSYSLDFIQGRFNPFFCQESKLPSFSFSIHCFAELDFIKNELKGKKKVGDYAFFNKIKDTFALSFCQSYVLMNDDFSQAKVYLADEDKRQSEYVVSYLLMQAYMFRLVVSNSFMIHSSVAVYNNCGILFCGASGAGKSTQANLWKKYLGAWILNYDKPCIIKDNDKYIVHGSPWSGKEALYINEYYPIKAIVFVIQSKEIKLEKISSAEAYGKLFLHNYVYPLNEEIELQYAQVINSVSKNISVYNLYCDISKDSVSTLFYKLFDEKLYFDQRKGNSMKYKFKSNFQMNKIADEYIVIPRGNIALDFSATVVFNETGAYLWGLLENYSEIDELAAKLSKNYSIGFDEAKNDTEIFIKKMIENDLLDIMDE